MSVLAATRPQPAPLPANLDTPRQQVVKRWGAMKAERSSHVAHWMDLSDNILPRRSRFLTTDRNRGNKRNDKIVNNTPTRGQQICSSGMMGAITPRGAPWFRMTTGDPALDEFGPVATWLFQVADIIRIALLRSNFYNCLHNVYSDLATFGTSTLHIDEDDERLLHCYVFPIGQYALSNDPLLRVDTVYREFSMTTRQLIRRFGELRVSRRVREAYQKKDLEQWFDVIHLIEPREDYDPAIAGGRGMPWRSCWLESSREDAGDRSMGFLQEGGYEEQPFASPRWNATGEDVYGSSPGMDCLGDCKALQLLERKKAQGVERMIDPPMAGPGTLVGQFASLMPGSFTPVDIAQGGQKFEPAVVIHPNAIAVTEASINEHEQRINDTFLATLWLLLSRSDGKMTATEVAQRQEEKVLQLGPVLERIDTELLDPVIGRAFGICLRAGKLPPPPPELFRQGVRVRPEYISTLAQAYKILRDAQPIERATVFTAELSKVHGEVLDNLNYDKAVRKYVSALGVDPEVLRSEEEVAQMRQARQAQQQAQAQGQAMLAATQGAKNLAGSDLSGDNALQRMFNNAAGLGGAGAGVPSA